MSQNTDRASTAHTIVQPHRYSAKVTHQGAAKQWPMLRGIVLEHDVQVATFYRPAKLPNFVPAIQYKFHSEAARNRFDDFADSSTIEETIEALLP